MSRYERFFAVSLLIAPVFAACGGLEPNEVEAIDDELLVEATDIDTTTSLNCLTQRPDASELELAQLNR